HRIAVAVPPVVRRTPPRPRTTLFPYTTLFRSHRSEFICNLLDGVHVGFSISLISRAEIIWYAPTTKGYSSVKCAMAVSKTMRSIAYKLCPRPADFLPHTVGQNFCYHHAAIERQ